MQVNQWEYNRLVGEFIRGELVLTLPGDVQKYPYAEQREAMQHVAAMSEITDDAGQYGTQFQRVDGQTVDVLWDWA